jgi:hypothetical protein
VKHFGTVLGQKRETFVHGQAWYRCIYSQVRSPILAIFSLAHHAFSMANPWLDWMPPASAAEMATSLNTDLEEYCATSPSVETDPSLKRLYGFGVLPLAPSVEVSDVVSVVRQVSELPHLRGVIISTQGLGKGLDDERLEPVWQAISEMGLTIFLHPHYGVRSDVWGEKDNGHVLSLALGFTFETTIVSILDISMYWPDGDCVGSIGNNSPHSCRGS